MIVVEDGDVAVIRSSHFVYWGQIKGQIMAGVGCSIMNDKSVYSGFFKDGQRHGVGKLAAPDHEFVGEFDQGKKHGYGSATFKDGKKVRGQYCKGRLQGFSELKTEERAFVAEFHEDKIEGIGSEIFEGGRYIGQFKASKRNGVGLLIEGNRSYRGYWKDDIEHGFGVEDLEDFKYEGSFVDGIKRGYGRETMNNGNSIYLGCFADGFKQGFGRLDEGQDIYIGEYNKGDRSGFGYLKASSNIYFGSWVDNCREGFGLQSSSKGEFKGEWKENTHHGKAVVVGGDGSKLGLLYNKGVKQRMLSVDEIEDVEKQFKEIDIEAFLSGSNAKVHKILDYVKRGVKQTDTDIEFIKNKLESMKNNLTQRVDYVSQSYALAEYELKVVKKKVDRLLSLKGISMSMIESATLGSLPFLLKDQQERDDAVKQSIEKNIFMPHEKLASLRIDKSISQIKDEPQVSKLDLQKQDYPKDDKSSFVKPKDIKPKFIGDPLSVLGPFSKKPGTASPERRQQTSKSKEKSTELIEKYHKELSHMDINTVKAYQAALANDPLLAKYQTADKQVQVSDLLLNGDSFLRSEIAQREAWLEKDRKILQDRQIELEKNISEWEKKLLLAEEKAKSQEATISKLNKTIDDQAELASMKIQHLEEKVLQEREEKEQALTSMASEHKKQIDLKDQMVSNLYQEIDNFKGDLRLVNDKNDKLKAEISALELKLRESEELAEKRAKIIEDKERMEKDIVTIEAQRRLAIELEFGRQAEERKKIADNIKKQEEAERLKKEEADRKRKEEFEKKKLEKEKQENKEAIEEEEEERRQQEQKKKLASMIEESKRRKKEEAEKLKKQEEEDSLRKFSSNEAMIDFLNFKPIQATDGSDNKDTAAKPVLETEANTSQDVKPAPDQTEEVVSLDSLFSKGILNAVKSSNFQSSEVKELVKTEIEAFLEDPAEFLQIYQNCRSFLPSHSMFQTRSRLLRLQRVPYHRQIAALADRQQPHAVQVLWSPRKYDWLTRQTNRRAQSQRRQGHCSNERIQRSRDLRLEPSATEEESRDSSKVE